MTVYIRGMAVFARIKENISHAVRGRFASGLASRASERRSAHLNRGETYGHEDPSRAPSA